MTKILLVEDDKSLREIYGVRLLAEGYDIVSAGDGEEALAAAIKERPQLILSDVMMPKISGFDMLDILRSTTETKNIKIIIMTALSGEEQRQRGESLGADLFLVKSQVGIEDVVRAVKNVLEGDNNVPVAPQPQTPNPLPRPSDIPKSTTSSAPQRSSLERVIQPTNNPEPQYDAASAIDNALKEDLTAPSFNQFQTAQPQPSSSEINKANELLKQSAQSQPQQPMQNQNNFANNQSYSQPTSQPQQMSSQSNNMAQSQYSQPQSVNYNPNYYQNQR